MIFFITSRPDSVPNWTGTEKHTRTREYARGRRERRNRFRPADVAFFSSESDKNVALIFRKIRCFNIHFNIHTCHQLVFDLGRSSTRYPSGLHKKSIRGRGPVWEGSWCFPAKNKRDSLSACAMRRFANVERIRHTNLTARLPKKCFLPARSMPANITLKEMCVCVL